MIWFYKEAQKLHDKLTYELWQHEHFDEKPKRLWEEAAVRWIKEKSDKKASKTISAACGYCRNCAESIYII